MWPQSPQPPHTQLMMKPIMLSVRHYEDEDELRLALSILRIRNVVLPCLLLLLLFTKICAVFAAFAMSYLVGPLTTTSTALDLMIFSSWYFEVLRRYFSSTWKVQKKEEEKHIYVRLYLSCCINKLCRKLEWDGRSRSCLCYLSLEGLDDGTLRIRRVNTVIASYTRNCCC